MKNAAGDQMDWRERLERRKRWQKRRERFSAKLDEREALNRKEKTMPRALNIYDPVRIQLLDDLVHKILDKDFEFDDEARIEIMMCIQSLRELVRSLAPPGSSAQRTVQQRLTHHPEWFNMIYWDEYSAAEYRKIADRKKVEESAIAWIGA